jgi:phosphoadenosine phosphosulfate reductase
MRYILRQHELRADEWRYLGEEAPEGAPLIVPWSELRSAAERWRAHPGLLGVRLTPAERVEELAPQQPQLALVAVEFPNAGDGRGYSQGRFLRERLAFSGELRAVGAGVRQDQVFLLARCGFDALELAAGEDVEAARRGFHRYDVGYQPGAAQVALRLQRFRNETAG